MTADGALIFLLPNFFVVVFFLKSKLLAFTLTMFVFASMCVYKTDYHPSPSGKPAEAF